MKVLMKKETATVLVLVMQFVMAHLIAIQSPSVNEIGSNNTTEINQLIEGIYNLAKNISVLTKL
jgi:hypothetical protein